MSEVWLSGGDLPVLKLIVIVLLSGCVISSECKKLCEPKGVKYMNTFRCECTP